MITSGVILPAEVRTRIEYYLSAVDTALPGFVTGLYVVGSVALGAWQTRESDIDTLIATSRAAGPDDLTTLAAIHTAMPAGSKLDGVYLSPALLAEQPVHQQEVPFVVNGEFHPRRRCGELNPVVWLILSRYGLVVRGPAVAELGVTVDSAALRQFNLENLRDYWQGLAGEVLNETLEVDKDAPVEGARVAWVMLGPARLHYTLTHLDVVSKSGSAAYLAELFPEWGDLAERAVRWRTEEEVPFTVGDLRTAAHSTEAIVADAWTQFGV